VWQRVWAALQQEANQRGEVAWDIHFIDSTIVRAHQHAAGAKKARRQRKA
jgi:transposase